MPARNTSTDKTDDGAATTTSDASTAQGDAAASVKPATDPQRIVIEQPPAEPAVFYGDGGVQAPTASAPVKANYKPFEW